MIDPVSMTLGWLTGKRIASQRRKPQGEPVAYLYGHVAKEGEAPTHTINGVDYVGAVLPDINTVYTPELQKTHPYAALVFDPIVGTEEWRATLYVTQEPADASYRGVKSPSASWRIASSTLNGIWNLPVGVWGDYSELRSYVYDEDEPTWANYPVPNKDGSTFREFSDPIPVSGIVAYSYNGTVLPDINTVYTPEQQKTHPYAYITNHFWQHALMLSPVPLVVSNFDTDEKCIGTTSEAEVVYYMAKSGPWEYLGTYSESGDIFVDEVVVWSNYDITDIDDNSLFMAASEPIPVYE
jgi:hypothetical protein